METKKINRALRVAYSNAGMWLIGICFMFITYSAAAHPPKWAPAYGFRSQSTYVYFPDYNFYYDIRRNVYFVWAGSNWVTYATLPGIFTNVNLAVTPQIQLSVTTMHPYYYNLDHRKKYKHAPSHQPKTTKKGSAPVLIIKQEHREPSYKPSHGNGHGNNHGNGHGKGKH